MGGNVESGIKGVSKCKWGKKTVINKDGRRKGTGTSTRQSQRITVQ